MFFGVQANATPTRPHSIGPDATSLLMSTTSGTPGGIAGSRGHRSPATVSLAQT